MRRAVSASRTYGRYAVGLRPILDPETSTRRAPKTRRTPKERSTRTRQLLTGPLLQE